jgi:hypothetical protein
MNTRNRAFALGGIVIALAAILILWGTTLTFASQGSQPSREPSLDPTSVVDPKGAQELNLPTAADQAETFADDVYSGLDTTKEIIGKTEARKQAIEQGRTKASGKLKGLAERARQAHEQQDDAILSDTDRRVLKHISE